MTRVQLFMALLFIGLIAHGGASDARSQARSSGTSEFVLSGNRIFVELSFVRPNGTSRQSLVFVDMGSPSMVLSSSLYKELGLDQEKRLSFRLGEMTIDVDAGSVAADVESWLPFSVGDHSRVEAVLPAGVLRNFQVVIDYAQRTLTLAKPGTLDPRGAPVPFRIHPETGLIVVDAMIAGKSYPVTIDNGSGYTWLRKTAAREWLVRHPKWQRGIGAVGAGNMRMADDGIEAAGAILRIPVIKLGSVRLREVGALAISPTLSRWDFIDWYSKKNPEPVIGWLGGNVLREFKITIDYPAHQSYWLRQTSPGVHDLDQVGITLMARPGGYFVAAIVSRNGRPTVEGVEPGDKLLRVDSLQANTATRNEILTALHGQLGEFRILTLERKSRIFTARAAITEF